MRIKNDLQTFYDTHAKHFSQTRKKNRPEFTYVLQEIEKLANNKKIRILELWCGDGRLLRYISERIDTGIEYTGVDFAQGLIDIAKSHTPSNKKHTAKRICEDMKKYVENTKQESYDFVICIASFQHIPTSKERLYIMKNIYKTLVYDGSVIMLNRALSQRAIKKYRKNYIASLLRAIIPGSKHTTRDLYIPRKHKNGIEHRYYHFFSLKELHQLSIHSGFIVSQCQYIDTSYQLTQHVRNAQNSLLIGHKSVYYK